MPIEKLEMPTWTSDLLRHNQTLTAKINELIDAFNDHNHNFLVRNIPGDGTVHELSTIAPKQFADDDQSL